MQNRARQCLLLKGKATVRAACLQTEIAPEKIEINTKNGGKKDPKNDPKRVGTILSPPLPLKNLFSPTQEPPPSPFWAVNSDHGLSFAGEETEFPFLYRFTVLLNSGGSNYPWSEFCSEFPNFMGMGVVPAPSIFLL